MGLFKPNIRKIASIDLTTMKNKSFPIVVSCFSLIILFFSACTPNIEKLAENNDADRLIKALEYKDWEIRKAAAKELGEIGDAKAVEGLIQALEDEKRPVRQFAAAALGNIGDVKAVEPLLTYLSSTADNISFEGAAAIDALFEIGLDPTRTDELSQALDSMEDYSFSKTTQHVFDEEREPSSLEVWYAALGQLGDPRSVQAIFDSLYDSESEIQAFAINALVKSKEDAFGTIIDSMGSAHVEIRNTTIQALTGIGEPVVDSLILKIDSEEKYERSAAIRVLGEIEDKSAVDKLVEIAINDPEKIVRIDAAEAIGKIGDEGISLLVEEYLKQGFEGRQSVWEALQVIGVPAIPLLSSEINDSDEVDCSKIRYAALLIGLGGSANTIEYLDKCLNDPDIDIQNFAANLLSDTSTPLAVPPLIDYAAERCIVDQCDSCGNQVYDPMLNLGQNLPDNERITDLENSLLTVFYTCGNKSMANDFLNSGNEVLIGAAENWASENGYVIANLPSIGGNDAWGSE